MDTPRINITRHGGGFYPNEREDYEWAHEQRSELLVRYGEGVVLAYQKQVVGHGKTLQDALEDAERNLPPDVSEITPIIELTGNRRRFFRVQ